MFAEPATPSPAAPPQPRYDSYPRLGVPDGHPSYHEAWGGTLRIPMSVVSADPQLSLQAFVNAYHPFCLPPSSEYRLQQTPPPL